MAKTSLDPTTVGQLKKLFIEILDGKDLQLKSGRVKLSNGKRVVGVPWRNPHPWVMPIGTTAGPTYVADVTEKYKFTIVSSSSSDSAEVFWFALGG